MIAAEPSLGMGLELRPENRELNRS